MEKWLICLLLLISSGIAMGQSGDHSEWKGFERHDFTFKDREARVIIPQKALPGNPWVWRARFPDWHTEADSILLEEGFHVAYLNTDHLFGSDSAVMLWDAFHRHLLLQPYQLAEKVALAGVSRGGLFVHRYAARYPDRVHCLYAEAPVCDFKSWPAGFGNGKGSPKDWENLKKAYGFQSDEEAKGYGQNPIDVLPTIARAKIPILHMIGLNDQIVPPKENSLVLAERYIQLGGPITIVPCTQEPQRSSGHHFPIETPRLVADFIKYHSLKGQLLPAADYHTFRSGLLNSRLKFEREKRGTVAFLGGSITQNPGWRDSVKVYLQQRFPQTAFTFVDAGISSMGSTPAAFRLRRDVLSVGEVDLLFEEAAVNDATNGRTPKAMRRGMEGIVRGLRTTCPTADVVLMHFVDPDKMATYRSGEVPDVVQQHEAVTRHYSLNSINLAKEVTDRIDRGEFSWEKDFQNLHPSPFGQGVYARSIINFLETAYSGHIDRDDKVTAHVLPEKLERFCYENGKLWPAKAAKTGKGWQWLPNWKAAEGEQARPNYTDVPMLVAEAPSGKLSFPFEGTAVGIAVAAGPDAGTISYRIDKGEWKNLDLFTKWSSALHLPWYFVLADELPDGKHRLELKVVGERNPQSRGSACRIRYFFVNGAGK